MAESPGANRLDRALDFALGLLSETEERALLVEARGDPELETLLREQCAASELARATPAQEPVARAVKFRRPAFLVAGAALAAAVALFMILQPQPETSLLWLPVDEVVSAQRGGDGGFAELHDGLAAYAVHDLELAIASLRDVQVRGAVSDLRNLYLASALLNSGRNRQAGQVLARVALDSLPYPWREQGQELRARCDRANLDEDR